MNYLIAVLYGEYEVTEKRAATQEVSEAEPRNRLQLSPSKKVFKQLQDN